MSFISKQFFFQQFIALQLLITYKRNNRAHVRIVILAIISLGTRVNVTQHKIAQVQAIAQQVHSRPIPYNRSLFANCTEKVICLDYRDMTIIGPLKRRLYIIVRNCLGGIYGNYKPKGLL